MFSANTITFGAPTYLPFILITGFCILLFYFLQFKRCSKWIESVSKKDTRNFLFTGLSSFHRTARFATITCFLLLFLISFIRPQWGKSENIVQREGRDVVVALDISRSMQGSDVLPTRLEAAKLKLKVLLSRLHCERMGLVLFSGSAFTQSPLTIDYDAFMSYLDQVDSEMIASGTTAIDKALLKSAKLFESDENSGTKIILLITDGEDFSSHLSEASEIIKSKNIQIIALGVGTEEGAPIPKKDRTGAIIGYEKTATGDLALSKLNIKRLQEITQKISGHCVASTLDDQDIDSVVEYIQKLEKKRFDDKKVSLHEERYPFFISAAAFFYALHSLI
ncbi:VWA domain-containing protein [Candidatus Dependentiae bacterium]|nr:VWA domain-containing protein [Candidatus Dependentiae bacterium]